MLKHNKYIISAITAMSLSATAIAEETVTKDNNKKDKVILSHPLAPSIIIKYKNTNSASSSKNSFERAKKLSSEMGMKLVFKRTMSGNAEVFTFDSSNKSNSVTDINKLVEELNKRNDIEYAEIDALQIAYRNPNDTIYNSQWHYHEETAGMRLPGAWDITTGSSNVSVAVLDTGYRPHADLNPKIIGGYDMISSTFVGADGDGRDANAEDPGDFYAAGECNETPPRAEGSSWHGTHVAGTVGAASNNNSDVAGVAWGVNIVPVRVLGKCGGSVADIADGIRWAAGLNVLGVPDNQNPVQIINMSLGGNVPRPCPATYQNAINDVVAAGVTVVVAAGNENSDESYSPGNCNNVITVGATSRRGARANYSNFGANIDISAPGGEGCEPLIEGKPTNINECLGGSINLSNRVLSTLNSGTSTPAADSIGAYQGTSMAAPHIAGLAALMYSVKTDITPAEVKATIKANARAFPTVTNHQCTTTICGTGMADATATLQAVLAGNNADPVANFTFNCNNLDCNFDGSSSTDNDGTISSYAWSFGATAANADHTFSSAGTFQVSLTVTDNNGATDSISQNVTVTQATSNNTELVNEDIVFDLSAPKGNELRFTIEVPEGASDLLVDMFGGTGDADLYVKFGGEPTTSDFNCRPYLIGNNEHCFYNQPQVGTYHILLHAYEDFSDVVLGVSYLEPQQSYFESVSNVAIPDNNPNGGYSSIDIDRTRDANTVRISYDIIHTYRQDLTVILYSPSGSSVLRYPSGGSDDNISESIILDLNGVDSNGTWTLEVIDDAAADTGYIDSWSIEFL